MSENKTKVNTPRNSNKVKLPFSSLNFYMMGACMLMIIVGFLLMSGGGSDDPTAFNPDIFSTRRIVVGPTITFLGFLFMAFAIIWSPRKKKEEKNDTVTADAADENTKIIAE